MDMPDLPCDFTEFLARRRALSSREAEELLAAWLASYQPIVRPVESRVEEEHASGDYTRQVANF